MLEESDLVHVNACKFFMQAITVQACPNAMRNPFSDSMLYGMIQHTMSVPQVDERELELMEKTVEQLDRILEKSYELL